MVSNMRKPAYEPEMAAFLDAYQGPKDMTRELIPATRQIPFIEPSLEYALAGQPYTHEERQVDSQAGPVVISIFRPSEASADRIFHPGLFFTHGGGLFSGNRFQGVKEYLQLAKPVGAILVTVEYRRTPEHPYPAAIDDCWVALTYVATHAMELRIDPNQIMVCGPSAGGNLAAALALRARDQGWPKLAAQLLDCPMLDDRSSTTSARQYVSEGMWSRDTNVLGWELYIGDDVGKADVSYDAAPARCTDLSGLPPAFVTVGSAEVFRDECVAYATELWRVGVQCELHVWPGGFHIFDVMMPMHPISIASMEAKIEWVKRHLAGKSS